ITLFTVVVVFILFVVLCTYVRRPYEKIIVQRFGSLIEEEKQTRIAGNWYFKYPTDTVIRIDTRLHLKALTFKEFNTANREPVNIRAYAVWHIVDPIKFKKKADANDDTAEGFIEQRLLGLIGQNVGTRNLNDFFNTDPKTEQAIRDMETKIAKDATVASADGKTPGLTDIGVEIADVGFSRIAFPPENTDAVYGRMVADLNQRASEYQASGIAEANKIQSEGSAEAAKIRAEAIAEAQGIRGEADRKALEILAGVAKTDAQKEFYEYWKTLDFLRASLSKNTIMVLSTDSPFLKRLFGAMQNSPIPSGPPSIGQVLVPGAPPASQPATQPGGR
ncbi:MAG TPA: SPFH domain-containing protein, partial [Phycisphaerae bacterium]|nr:SPFH domain-containing protein [Phycisphaerae bacterium]